jgi:hypothetical protein
MQEGVELMPGAASFLRRRALARIHFSPAVLRSLLPVLFHFDSHVFLWVIHDFALDVLDHLLLIIRFQAP